MYIIQNESFGTRKPSTIEYYSDQVVRNEGIYSEEVPVEIDGTNKDPTETVWFATTSTHYKLVEWNAYLAEYNSLEHDISIVNAYESALAVKAE